MPSQRSLCVPPRNDADHRNDDLGSQGSSPRPRYAVARCSTLGLNTGLTYRNWRGKILNINLKAAMHVGQIVARSMISKGTGGNIVNISSQASLMAFKSFAAYGASKAALDMLTKTMALELATHKIRVNSVNPTVVLTELGKRSWSDPVRSEVMMSRIPMNKFAEVKDVVNAVVYLLSDKADMITGTCLPIEGGFVTAGV
ncbi:D-erythrulose reductase-like [Saccoglossus kowalevskii]|uniref:D-erythrulose reductase-like n=1 Tax=Saccoglossus kowalevskii TaxID=10224 RepID=A0ABM0MUP2_SACKO|nr:PREDICTED: D-erythrulose reductase-like [Saccoglossus kowalevskii]